MSRRSSLPLHSSFRQKMWAPSLTSFDPQTGHSVGTGIGFIGQKLCLPTVETHQYSTWDKAWDAFQKLEQARTKLEYECDGIVIRANSIECQKRLGTSSDLRPKGQRCIKFAPMGEVTTLEAVEIDVGHTGAIAPRAILKPVRVGGVTITHATLSNFEEIERLNIAIGDKDRKSTRLNSSHT